MRYAQIRKIDISNGEGCGVALFTQGCNIHCRGCFNTIAWNYNGGKEWDKESEELIYKLLSNEYISRFSVLGGEPFSEQNFPDLLILLKRIKVYFPDKKIWAYTGHTYEELLENETYKKALYYIDVLVDGHYDESQRDLTLKFRGSKNQRIIDLKTKREVSYV